MIGADIDLTIDVHPTTTFSAERRLKHIPVPRAFPLIAVEQRH